MIQPLPRSQSPILTKETDLAEPRCSVPDPTLSTEQEKLTFSLNQFLGFKTEPSDIRNLPDELYEIAHEWNRRRKEALENDPTLQPNAFSNLFCQLFLKLSHLHQGHHWHAGFLDEVCLDDEKLSFAKELLTTYFDEFIQNLPAFHFDESTRKALLLEALQNGALFENAAAHVFDFSLEEEQNREEIAQTICAQNPLLFLSHFHTMRLGREEVRYDLLKKACHSTHKNPLFCQILGSAALTADHRYEFALFFGTRALLDTFFCSLAILGLDQCHTEKLFLQLNELNPALLFEHAESLPVSNNLKERLRVINRFTPIEGELLRLHTSYEYDFQRMKEPLKDLLSSLHAINRKVGIPSLFYMRDEERSLGSLIKHVASQCSPKDLLDLIHLLNETFFCGTSALMGEVLQAILPTHPELNEFLTFINEQFNSYQVHNPCLTLLGVRALLAEKLSRKKPPVSTKVYFCHVSELVKTLDPLIHDQNIQRGLLCVVFGPPFHYSSLLFEKNESGTLNFISFDSVIQSAPVYYNFIKEKLSSARFPYSLNFAPFQRQADFYSCSLFTFTDIFAILKGWNQDPFRSRFELFQNDPPQYPPHMLRLTQCMSKVRDRGEERLVSKGVEMTLQHYFDEHTYVSFDLSQKESGFHPCNLTAKQKLCIYFERIIKSKIAQGATA